MSRSKKARKRNYSFSPFSVSKRPHDSKVVSSCDETDGDRVEDDTGSITSKPSLIPCQNTLHISNRNNVTPETLKLTHGKHSSSGRKPLTLISLKRNDNEFYACSVPCSQDLRCPRYFGSIKALVSHVAAFCREYRDFSCFHCDDEHRLSNLGSLRKHLYAHYSQNAIFCNHRDSDNKGTCRIEFTSAEDYSNHVTEEHGNGQWQNQMAARHRRALERINTRVNEPLGWECTICDQHFETDYSALDHGIENHIQKQQICLRCGFRMPDHAMGQHKALCERSGTLAFEEGAEWLCPYAECLMRFSNNDSFLQHFRRTSEALNGHGIIRSIPSEPSPVSRLDNTGE